MIFKRTISQFLLVMLLGTVALRAHAQTSHEVVFDATQAFSAAETYGTPVYEENDGEKHYLVALSGAVLTEFIIAGWNRWVVQAPWAKVGWHDVRTFYEKKWFWDNDWFWTNFVLHPYQGALSYMAARSANLNRIESLVLTAACDAAWEWFFELNQPSKNDLVYSFVGAFVVGEMFYRLSLEADSIHRLFGYALNPERMWSELWTRQRPRGTVGNIYALSVGAALGATVARTNAKQSLVDEWNLPTSDVFPVWFVPELYIVYNDPYGHDSNNPYSQFELRMGMGLGVGSGNGRSSVEEKLLYNISIFSNGMLLARAPEWGENRDTTIGIVFDYDFRWHPIMDLSALSPGVAIKQRINYEASRIEWQAHLGVNLVGTTDFYFRHRLWDMAGRDYSFTFGPELVLMWKYATDSGWSIDTNFHGYIMWDFGNQKLATQTTGWEFIGLAEVNAEMPLSSRVRLGLRNELYLKEALYDDNYHPGLDRVVSYGNVFQVMYSGGVYAKLQLK